MEQRHIINNLKRFAEEVRISVEQVQPPPAPNATMFRALEAFGRERLSTHYFMRDFLYSEIAAVHGIPNVPDDPELAIEAGKGLCGHLLEPLRDVFGHITIRSAFRSTTVNGYGNEHGLPCAGNEKNYARHIWDHRDKDGIMGATACIIVPWFLEYPKYRESEDWRPLAWFIHDKLPYSEMEFYPKNAAFNLTWREEKERRDIRMCSGWASHAARLGKGYGSTILTKPGYDNHEGDHSEHYQGFPGIQPTIFQWDR